MAQTDKPLLIHLYGKFVIVRLMYDNGIAYTLKLTWKFPVSAGLRYSGMRSKAVRPDSRES